MATSFAFALYVMSTEMEPNGQSVAVTARDAKSTPDQAEVLQPYLRGPAADGSDRQSAGPMSR
jgi:hypothetical protein